MHYEEIGAITTRKVRVMLSVPLIGSLVSCS